MILPIYAFGQPVLKKKAENFTLDKAELDVIIANMRDTMVNSKGVGLAGPQVGLSKRIFLVDSTKLKDDDDRMSKNEKGISEVFINAEMLEESGGLVSYEEGCLSIPNLYGMVDRERDIKIRYYNANLELQEKSFTGFTARIIQHEYDHIEGNLFVEKLKPLKKQMIKRKLENIKKGEVNVNYKMKFV